MNDERSKEYLRLVDELKDRGVDANIAAVEANRQTMLSARSLIKSHPLPFCIGLAIPLIVIALIAFPHL